MTDFTGKQKPQPGGTSTAVRMTMWLRDVVRAEKKVDRVDLTHAPQGDRVRAVRTWQTEDLDEAKLGDLAGEITAEMQEDAEGLGGSVQLYMLTAYVDSELVASRPFREMPPMRQWKPGEQIDTEAPNAVGLTTQAMRHLEIQTRGFLAALGGMLDNVQRENARLMDRNEHLEAAAERTSAAREALLNDAHARKLNELEREASIRRKDSMARMGLQLGAHIANKATGQAMFPETMSPRFHQFRSLVRSFANTPDKLQALRFMCDSEAEYQALLDVMENEIKAEDAEKAAADNQPAAAAGATKE